MSEFTEPKTIDDEFKDVSDDQFDEEQDRIEEEVRSRFSEDVRNQLDNLTNRFEALEKQINLTLDMRLFFDALETRYTPLDENFRATDERYKRMEEKTAKEKDKVGDEKRDARSKMRRRIVLAVLGLSLGLGGLIYYLVKMNKAKEPEPDDQFTQDDADKAKKLLEQWRAEKDSDFWKSIADYVNQNKPSLQSQMEMMAYVKNWTTASPITWDTTEKGDDIQALIDAAAKGKPGDLYTAAAALTHAGALLERAVVADLCENAVANILADSDAGGDGDNS